ncbi:MAG: oxidoreductase [Candidatus Thiodiazotropha sp.]
MFQAILIEKSEDQYRSTLKDINDDHLPDGDVTVRVAYSTLNYKDALAITGKSPVIRRFPMIPGIDLAGAVETSNHPSFQTGDPVLLNGWGVGESHEGGLAQKARVKGDWLIPIPAPFSPRQAMAIGTAGYTAMLCVLTLERGGITPTQGEILVTGATGGVGSIAVALLTKLGYRVVAISGKREAEPYLKTLGAVEVLERSDFDKPGNPLGKARWSGAIDVVGGQVLANVCATTQYGGVVAACGLAGGMAFPATVAPFILRGVTLAGVDSVMCPRATRLEAWTRLARDLDIAKLDALTQEIGLSETTQWAESLLAGQIQGRIVVDVNR